MCDVFSKGCDGLLSVVQDGLIWILDAIQILPKRSAGIIHAEINDNLIGFFLQHIKIQTINSSSHKIAENTFVKVRNLNGWIPGDPISEDEFMIVASAGNTIPKKSNPIPIHKRLNRPGRNRDCIVGPFIRNQRESLENKQRRNNGQKMLG